MSDVSKGLFVESCDVCGKTGVHMNVCASTCGPVTLSYCDECLSNGLEPYDFVVAYLADSRSLDELSQYYQELVKKVCDANSKTIEQFFEDCRKLDKRYGDGT